MSADAGGDPAVAATVPLLREGDAIGEAPVPNRGIMRVIAIAEMFEFDIEHLVSELRSQACLFDERGEAFRRVPDIVDGGHASADHLGGAEHRA